VQGLHTGDQVDMLGKKIGRVSQTRIKGQKIAVELSIDNSFSFSIPIDSKIEVKSEGLIGSKFISITPGFNRKDFILPGATVEGLREFDFTELTPDIVPMTHDLSAFARQLKATLGDEEKKNIQMTLKNMESFSIKLDEFISSHENLISTEDKNNFQLTIKNLRELSSELKNGVGVEIKKIDEILNNVKIITDEPEKLKKVIDELHHSAKFITSMATKLDEIFSRIEEGGGTLGKLINEDSIHQNVNGLVNDLRSVVKDFKNNPTKYMKAYWKGKK
jgi:phospholipid/cholesterol/gamma-HCH transport system substrate-binding protein